MRVIPSVIKTGTPESEKRVFGSLLKIDIPNGICFHSLNLPDHIYKKEGESDFVLVTKRGILILEVKGGEASVCPDTGYWKYGINKVNGESIARL